MEILSISGDVRCFLMAETPIKGFLASIVGGEVSVGASEAEGHHPSTTGHPHSGHDSGLGSEKKSFIRQLWALVKVEGTKLFALFLLAVLIGGIVRMGAIPQSRSSSLAAMGVLLLPLASVCLFFLPLALPYTLVLAEAAALADLLASVEVILGRPAAASAKNSADSGKLSSEAASPMHSTNGCRGAVGGVMRDSLSDGAALELPERTPRCSGASAGQPGHGRNGRGSRGKRPRRDSCSSGGSEDLEVGGSAAAASGRVASGRGTGAGPDADGVGVGGDGDDNDVGDDEFQDDLDIDERAEHIAEGVSTQVTWVLFLAYLHRVLRTRLGLLANDGFCCGNERQNSWSKVSFIDTHLM